MSEYRFHLEKYHCGSKTDYPNCGKKRCFVRYIDETGTVHFPASVGKCDHEQSCGYHYTPRAYFQDNPEEVSNDHRIARVFRQSVVHTRPAQVEPSYIPDRIVRATLSHYEINPLYSYLCGVFGAEETARLFNLYRVGTSAKWGGSTVFWQTDESGKVRTGKIMLYNPSTGRRVKEPQTCVSWAHAELRLPDFNLRQCLFGQHLLPLYPDRAVFLVESESQPLSLRAICPMRCGSPQEAKIAASMSRLSRLCADAMFCCSLTSERPMRGGRNYQYFNLSAVASVSVQCSKIWRPMHSAVRALI